MSTLLEGMQGRDEELRRRVFGDRVEHFVRSWAPANPRANAEFHRDLHMLIDDARRAAQEPLLRHLEIMLRALPVQAFVKTDPVGK